MSFLRFTPKAVVCWSLAVGAPGIAWADASYRTNGSEYAVAGTLPGDQVHPQVALASSGGFAVWEDNVTDGDGLGISALRLDGGFSAAFAPFRVNSIGAGDQEHPQVGLLKGGGAAFVWQGGKVGFQHIYARFLSSSNTWFTASDVLVNSFTNHSQMDAAIATLSNGNVIIAYSSLNQQASDSLQDVYGQLFSPTGQKIGGEFLVNQFTTFNQRTPSVAALAGGGFVVAWVSEQQRSGPVDNSSPAYVYSITNRPSVDIFARLYSGDGSPVSSEFIVNTNSDVCANPSVAATENGGFMVVWSDKDPQQHLRSWDIFGRPFSSAGVGGSVQCINTYLYGDQYAPRIAAQGADCFVVWTSLAQDGSREGVFGQFLREDGTLNGAELRVNTTTISQQMHPAVAADGAGRFLAVWTSFVGGPGSFDLYTQRYVNAGQALLPMNAPFVYVPFVFSNGVYQPQIQISWPLQAGLPVDHYEVYVDGSNTATASLQTNIWLFTGLAAGSTHTFQVAYVTADGRRSPLSASSQAAAWSGYNWGGIPFEWMALYYGGSANMFAWPPPNSELSPDGPTVIQVFLTGGNPLDSSTWLRTKLVSSPQGYFLSWNPQPGFTYQVQTSSNLSGWINLGVPRFAAGNSDSLFVGGSNGAYYRVRVLR